MINTMHVIDVKTPKVSVIVPVYNVESYLRQCLDSIINQTLKDIEIILIDDGSVDNSGCICDEYKNGDKRIRVVHKTHEGLSCARNYGVCISTAPYIMFVDSDDWVEPEFCKLPYVMADDNDADLVLFTHKIIANDGTIIRNKICISNGIVTKDVAMHYNLYVANAAWLGLYHRKLFNNILFPPGKYYEDVGTIHRLIYKAERICMVSMELYCHRVGRLGSITTGTGSRLQTDLKDMLMMRAQNLFDWGYLEDASNICIPMLIKYGYADSELKQLVFLAESIPVSINSNWKRRFLHMIFKISPAIFDAICFITGRRIR